MQKVRVKVYGLFSLTKRTYLVMQGVGLGLVVFLFTLGLCLPRPKPGRGELLPPLAVMVVRLLDGLPWLALLYLLAGAVETWIVLKKFARKEAEQRALAPGEPAPEPSLFTRNRSPRAPGEVMAFFPEIQRIPYEGPQSTNPLSFRHYNADEVVEGKPMREHFRFAVAYWHTMRNMGGDPFGSGCAVRPWEDGTDSVDMAIKRARVAFEFMEKLTVPFYCFHDRDVAPEGKNLAETNANLDKVVKVLKEEQARTGIKLLWGTANLFSNPRFVHGAATSPNADVFAYAAAQVKKALEVTKELGGVNYVFWGGREGYVNLWNTNMKRELDHLARFFHLAVDYKKKIGFGGQFLIEPKPKEPTTHQYDFDAAACINFLRAYGLTEHFKLNLETNHATLAGHTMMHEMVYASSQGLLGSVDANRGDMLLGWDTDQFPTDLYLTTSIMLVILGQGGLAPGGLNFDAKVRRESFEPVDLLHAHIGGMDAFARGLKIAAKIRADGVLKDFVDKRYASWDTGIGQQIESGKAAFEDLEKYMLDKGDAARNVSGRQEMLENIINRYLDLV